ncbi:MAG: radical SAM protein [Deltaproteobacteria bacterium]|nr:radical SAM protein [Deltaproteobacteria bacterium]
MTDFTKLRRHLDDSERVAQLLEVEQGLVEHTFPPQLVVENTSFCNLKCIHCSHREMQRPQRHMDRALWEKIVTEVGRESPACELWPTFYGEATILKDELWDRLDFAARAGCTNLVLNSNGTLLDRFGTIDKVLASPLRRFILSLDGLSPEVFEKIRAGARWDRVYPAVEELLRKRRERGSVYPVIIAQFSVMAQNAHEAEAFRDRWKALGAEVKIRPMLEWGAAGTVRTDTIQHGHPTRIACPWANNTMAIHQDGRVVACAVDYDANVTVGSVADMSLKDAWRRLGELLRRPHREHRWKDLPELCRGCGDWQTAGASYEPPEVEGTRPFWYRPPAS